jgi:NAD(P)H-dependent flavin oxidoreductase YrpB (nitropropane dioxygenase family)
MARQAQTGLSPGAAGVEAVVAGTRFLLSEEGGAHPV